jgi:hypothetical protein
VECTAERDKTDIYALQPPIIFFFLKEICFIQLPWLGKLSIDLMAKRHTISVQFFMTFTKRAHCAKSLYDTYISAPYYDATRLVLSKL